MKYQLSMSNINVSVNNQSLLIAVNMCPCSIHLLLSADIRQIERNPVFADNSEIPVSETPVNKVKNVYRSRKNQNCRKPKQVVCYTGQNN